MNIAFTLCSINYLPQAKTLFDSLKRENSSWHFIVGLVDKNVSNVDLSFIKCDIVEVDSLQIDGFNAMVERYTIVELVTSVKPYYFTWILDKFENATKIIYLDPDIMVFAPFNELERKLNLYDIILTPHFTSPIYDSLMPTEIHVFKTGVFNLGFLAVSRSENTYNMLKWWENKLRHDCIVDLTRGYFVDQLWMNLVPAYFDKVFIDKNPGYNMAHWNLHERMITKKDDTYLVNDVPLVFFHFSHFNPNKPLEIAAYHNRYTFESRPDLIDIFNQYTQNLLIANFNSLKQNSCFYMKNEKAKKRNRTIENFLRQALPSNIKGLLKKMLNK